MLAMGLGLGGEKGTFGLRVSATGAAGTPAPRRGIRRAGSVAASAQPSAQVAPSQARSTPRIVRLPRDLGRSHSWDSLARIEIRVEGAAVAVLRHAFPPLLPPTESPSNSTVRDHLPIGSSPPSHPLGRQVGPLLRVAGP